MAPRNDETAIAPTLAQQGVTTAPTLTAADEITELRQEIARLKGLLGIRGAPPPPPGVWPTAITYDQAPYSGARLMGITRQRERIRPSTEFQDLPKPTRDSAQLEADFVRWGYCLVADAMSPAQVQSQVERLLDQAAAERAAKVARMSHHGHAQLVFNLLPKGQVFRDLIALETRAAQEAERIESLLVKILGQGFYLATAHGSIVHERGGLQEMDQDQGFVPLPHPPFPLYCLMIWLYTDFGLEEGGTYIVPGSHRDAAGESLVRRGVEYEHLADDRLVALTAPAGTCLLTDSRLLHSGGKRTASGTRLASRILYARPWMRQQENQLAAMSDEMFQSLSPKLKGLVGFKPHLGLGMVDGNALDPTRPKVQVGELSMSRPEDFQQDFDARHSLHARRMAEQDWEAHVEYRGDDPAGSSSGKIA